MIFRSFPIEKITLQISLYIEDIFDSKSVRKGADVEKYDIINCTLEGVPIKKSPEACQLGLWDSNRMVQQSPSDHLDGDTFKVFTWMVTLSRSLSDISSSSTQKKFQKGEILTAQRKTEAYMNKTVSPSKTGVPHLYIVAICKDWTQYLKR